MAYALLLESLSDQKRPYQGRILQRGRGDTGRSGPFAFQLEKAQAVQRSAKAQNSDISAYSLFRSPLP